MVSRVLKGDVGSWVNSCGSSCMGVRSEALRSRSGVREEGIRVEGAEGEEGEEEDEEEEEGGKGVSGTVIVISKGDSASVGDSWLLLLLTSACVS